MQSQNNKIFINVFFNLKENESLQVVLIKLEQSSSWNSLLKDIEIQPGEIPAQPVREISMPPALSLQSEMEECDFGDDDMDREYSFGLFNF